MITFRKVFNTRRGVLLVGLVILILLIIFGIFFVIYSKSEDEYYNCNVCEKSFISPLGEQCSSSELGKYSSYAITTDSNVCAPAGKEVIDEGGNAVDAAIAVHLCMGVTIPESLGLGGGSLITIYNAKTKKSIFINAREMAPGEAYREMYNQTDKPKHLSEYGLESIAVPGELRGHHHIYKKYGSGRIEWGRLFKYAIKLATDGFKIGDHLANAIKQKSNDLNHINELREVYTNPVTKQLYRVGEIFKQPKLAITLKRLAESKDPVNLFYTTMAREIMDDLRIIQKNGQYPDQKIYIDEKDFREYDVIEHDDYSFPIVINNRTITLHTAHLPGSGILLQFIMRLMTRYNDLYPDAYTQQDKAELFNHRLMEAFKFAFANRQYLGDDRYDDVKDIVNRLNDDKYIDQVFKKISDDKTFDANDEQHYDKSLQQKFDSGTAHLSVIDKEGNAVAITATINVYFGSKVLSPSTGILLNDEMDDFNTGVVNDFDIPPSHANEIAKHKRPLSSMVPSIFTDDSGVRLVIGASGGPKIITAVAYTALRHLFFNENIKQSIDAARPHHQLHPDQVVYEACFPRDIVNSLSYRQHQTKQLPVNVRGAIVMAISRDRNGTIYANSDFRKGGTIAGI